MSRIDAELDRVRQGLDRLDARQAWDAVREGALLVDIRDSARRTSNGAVPGALVVEMTALEWRLDPTNDHVSDQARDPHRPIVIMCNEGYASSLAAHRVAALRQGPVTDLIGGFAAWREAGLPCDDTDEDPATPLR